MNRGRAIAARRAYMPPIEARSRWSVLVHAAIDIADRASGLVLAEPRAGRRGSASASLFDFAHLLVERGRPVFPVEGATPAMMAEAFLKVARAFVDAGTQERRETYAPALAAMARALDALLHDDRRERAQVWAAHAGDFD